MPYTTYVPPTDYQGKQLVPVRLHPISEPRVVGQQGTTLPQSAIPPYGQLFPPTRWFTDIVVPPIVYDEAVLFGTFPTATVGVPYVYDLFLAGGDGSWSNPRAIVGALPAWATLSIVSGKLRLSGTPTGSTTTVNITVAVDSGDGQTATSAQIFGVFDVVSMHNWPGASGSTSLIDATGKLWTGYGNAQVDTTYGQALLLDGAGDYATTPDSADFSFGSSDFVEEGYFRESVRGPIRQIIGQHTTLTGASSNCSFLLLSDNGKLTFQVFIGGVYYTAANPSTHAINTIHHYAAMRDGNVARLKLNGVQVASVAISGSVNNSTMPLTIGAVMNQSSPDPGGYFFSGRILSRRLTRGTCRYPGSGSFVPPPYPFTL